MWLDSVVLQIRQPFSNSVDLIVCVVEDANIRYWSIEQRDSSFSLFGDPVRVCDFKRQQSIGLPSNLVGRAVIDFKCVRAFTDINANSPPREGFLKNSLPEIAGEKQCVRSIPSQSRQESQLRRIDVLCFVDNSKIEWGILT